MFQHSLLLLIAIAITIRSTTAASSIVNKEIERVIDLSSAIVKVYVEIKAANVNDLKYDVIFPNEIASKLAFLAVKQNKKDLLIAEPVQTHNLTTYTVTVKDPSPKLSVEAVFTNTLELSPAEIAQMDNQFVKYSDSHYFLTPYKTETQKTACKLASATIESYTKLAPHTVRGSTISFGPYKDLEPMEASPLTLHFMNNKPFAKLSSVQRELEVSHWGNIAVEEVYELQHAGAKLKGGFSRFDYARVQSSHSFRKLLATLPIQANNIYYRDQIGNISTSDIRIDDDVMELEIQPRFPLFGGWQTQFYIGYSIPTETALFVDQNNRHKLKFDFFTIFEDVWVEDMEIKVVLPEGCYDVKVEVPYKVTEQSWGKRYTYLDSELNGGRPVLTLRAKNLVEEHDRQAVITYSFRKSRMLVEPAMLVLSYFALFVLASVVSRVGDKKTKQA